MASTTHSPDPAGRPYGGIGPAARQAQRQQSFLDAGLAVFGTSGYRTATVRQLCREAGLTDRYFYESFASTEDLLLAVYQRAFNALEDAVMGAILQAGSGDPDGLMAGLRAGLEATYAMAADPRVARVCWLEVLGVSPRVDQVYQGNFERYGKLITAIALQLAPHWKPSATEARVLGVGLAGAVSLNVTQWLLGGYGDSQSDMVNATLPLFTAVMRQLAIPPESSSPR